MISRVSTYRLYTFCLRCPSECNGKQQRRRSHETDSSEVFDSKGKSGRTLPDRDSRRPGSMISSGNVKGCLHRDSPGLTLLPANYDSISAGGDSIFPKFSEARSVYLERRGCTLIFFAWAGAVWSLVDTPRNCSQLSGCLKRKHPRARSTPDSRSTGAGSTKPDSRGRSSQEPRPAARLQPRRPHPS